MKKILMLLLVCALVFSLTLTMTSCGIFENLFGSDTPDTPDTPGPGPDPDPNPDDGINSEIIDGIINGTGNGIDLPIVDVNSQDMTQPPEGSEEGTEETPEAEQ
jgi:hypothetical protein